jgi:hypothetical protein
MRSILATCVGLAPVLAWAPAVRAQTFVNGDFANGTLNGWTVVNTDNGVGAPGAVVTIDIDGPGPLTPSTAAAFMVGLLQFQPNSQGGIEMTQDLTLTGGQTYAFNFDWSVQRLASVGNDGGFYALIVDGAAVATHTVGSMSGTEPAFGHFSANYSPSTTGSYRVGLRITRAYQAPGELTSYVDNLTVAPVAGPCYANCDQSSAPPVLNANDFQCFLDRFAAGESYANCDASTGQPALNANDFQCFLDRFASGCR